MPLQVVSAECKYFNPCEVIASTSVKYFFPQKAYAFRLMRQVAPLTFQSVDEMLLCYHSNETSSSDRFLSAIYFKEFQDENLISFVCKSETKRSGRVKGKIKLESRPD